MTSPIVHHLAVLACCAAVWAPLARARWTWRAPRVGIGLWQLLACAVVASVVGLPLQTALAPYGAPVPVGLALAIGDLVEGRLPAVLGPARSAVLVTALGVAVAFGIAIARAYRRVVLARRRHLDALALVARRDPAAGDALVLDHPGSAVYCVPGTSVVVLSIGVLRALSRAEVAAVMAHEHAHLRARHDLALLPFAALSRALPRSSALRAAHESVALLVEMCADDAAARRHGRTAVHGALLRFVDVALVAPPGALGVATGIATRVRRLAAPVRALPAPVCCLVVLCGLLVATTPLSQLAWPF